MALEQPLAPCARCGAETISLTRRVKVGGTCWCSGKCYALDLAVFEQRLVEQAREQLAAEPLTCNGCDAPILPSNALVDDGCPCNTPRGINFAPEPCAICGIDHCVRPGHRTNPRQIPTTR